MTGRNLDCVDCGASVYFEEFSTDCLPYCRGCVRWIDSSENGSDGLDLSDVSLGGKDTGSGQSHKSKLQTDSNKSENDFEKTIDQVETDVKKCTNQAGKDSGKTSNQKGEDLENLFELICDEYELNYTRGNFPAFFQEWWEFEDGEAKNEESIILSDYFEEEKKDYLAIPEDVRGVARRVGGRGGWPDYIVWEGEGTLDVFFSKLAQDIIPKSDAVFIEVKYRNPDYDRIYYTENQKTKIPELESHQAEVYTFQGTLENYWIDNV